VLSLPLAIPAVTMHRMSRFVALTIVVVILSCTVVAYAQSFVTEEHMIGGAHVPAERPDLTGVLPTITVPRWILFGKEESLMPIETVLLLQVSIPNAQRSMIDYASHGAILEQARRASHIIH
jgi:pimeloyl-ACP methyl ester carboxylesterase